MDGWEKQDRKQSSCSCAYVSSSSFFSFRVLAQVFERWTVIYILVSYLSLCMCWREQAACFSPPRRRRALSCKIVRFNTSYTISFLAFCFIVDTGRFVSFVTLSWILFRLSVSRGRQGARKSYASSSFSSSSSVLVGLLNLLFTHGRVSVCLFVRLFSAEACTFAQKRKNNNNNNRPMPFTAVL